MADVTLTVDGKTITAPAGTLLIEACKSAGIEIPAFCYYPGLSLQAACRMCVVRIEKQPKLATACTTTVAEGMVVATETPEIAQARKATLQLLLGNHPLDCPVCDAGGECELQDMTFKYGAADSFYTEPKNHREEQKWSPVVYFDRPRCILCYRCVRMCGEGMDVFALGIQNRGSSSVIAPNVPAQLSPEDLPNLDCEQCGMCIDACPVGALTSGTYRYKTRPWEMNHVATVCTHCGDGCKTTLGVRSVSDGSEIVRGDNRDKSGINGDFLCNKGRYAFDFANNIERLTSPLVRKDGKLVPVSWEEALTFAGAKLRELRDAKGANSIGVIGSNRTTNEENYLLQKFARTVIGTNNIDHHRTADFVTLVTAIGKTTRANGKTRYASQHCIQDAPAILLVGGDPTNEAPLTAWNARVYVANHQDIKLKRQAKAFAPVAEFGYAAFIDSLSADNDFAKAVKAEETLIVVVGNELRGGELASLIKALPDAKFALLADYANSRGAADMGLLPDALPGYQSLKGSTLASEYGAADAPGLDL
jgi:NADH-quinone oxidoreductase subunit G